MLFLADLEFLCLLSRTRLIILRSQPNYFVALLLLSCIAVCGQYLVCGGWVVGVEVWGGGDGGDGNVGGQGESDGGGGDNGECVGDGGEGKASIVPNPAPVRVLPTFGFL